MSDERDARAREGTRLIWSGLGIGLAGAASAALLGATCPLCVVGAPALVGWGAYQRWSARSDADSVDAGPSAAEAEDGA